jgi:hypothetical protein
MASPVGFGNNLIKHRRLYRTKIKHILRRQGKHVCMISFKIKELRK